MSTGHRAKTAVGKSFLSRFEHASEHELDCRDCVHFVMVRGRLDDAKTSARRHLEARARCETVTIADPETGQDLAIVTETDFEWMSDRDMPPYVAGSQ